MRNIDLLPPEYHEREELKDRGKLWGAAAGGTLALCLVAVFFFGARTASAKERLGSLSTAFAEMKEAEAKVGELKGKLGALVERNQAITSLLGQRAWCDILADLGERVRPNGWLESIELEKVVRARPGVAGAILGDLEPVETLVLGGFAADFLRLSALITTLKASPHVAGVELDVSQSAPAPLPELGGEGGAGPAAVRFSVRCELKRLGAA